MQELSNYRAVVIQINCPDWPEPTIYDLHTTLEDRTICEYALNAAAARCAHKDAEHCRVHTATVTEVPETGTGARRG